MYRDSAIPSRLNILHLLVLVWGDVEGKKKTKTKHKTMRAGHNDEKKKKGLSLSPRARSRSAMCISTTQSLSGFFPTYSSRSLTRSLLLDQSANKIMNIGKIKMWFGTV